MQHHGQASDSELWERACAGEVAAFGVLFERHNRAIYNHSFRRTADWSIAEEVTSLVFLEAWRRRESIQLSRSSALPWLLGIANNVLLNTWRSKRRHRKALGKLPPSTANDFSDYSDDRIDDVRRLNHLLALIKNLSAPQREILELVVWDGLNYEQAAVAAGIPVGTVRSRLARARHHLAQLEIDCDSLPDEGSRDKQILPNQMKS